MAYNINKTDGTLLANVPDGQVDILSSDITLIGKNYSGFGEALNENFVKLLENFANSSRPSKPVRGQLWYDTAEAKLKIYSGTGFVPVSSATVSSVRPAELGIGDLWFDSLNKQLYFFDGTDPVLLGPAYTENQRLSGVKVETVIDKNNVPRVITKFYNNGTLIGIFSTSRFTPRIPIVGFNDDTGLDKVIEPGFNQGYLSDLKFIVTADNALKLNGTDASLFARTDSQNRFTQQTLFSTDAGFSLGAGLLSTIDVSSGTMRLINGASNKNMELRVRRFADSELALEVISATREIKLYNGFSDSQVTVGGNLVITGNLTVNGDTTTVNVQDLVIEDKNIVLADLGNPSLNTDSNADGGGIVLKGASDHLFTYIYDSATPGSGRANESWYSTEHIALATGKSIYIDGEPVLSKNALGPSIVSFPGVDNFGILRWVDVGPGEDLATPPAPGTRAKMRLVDNRIGTVKDNLDLELEPHGTGDVSLIGTPRIIGLTTTNESYPQHKGPTKESYTTLSVEEQTEATNKKYVTNLVRTRTLALTFDNSDGLVPAQIALWLDQVAPPDEYENGTFARLLVSSLTNSGTSVNLNPLISKNNSVEYSKPSGTGFPIQDFSIATASIPAASVSVFRYILYYEIQGGTWVNIPSIP